LDVFLEKRDLVCTSTEECLSFKGDDFCYDKVYVPPPYGENVKWRRREGQEWESGGKGKRDFG
jgi:hypothetical protein